MSADGVSNAPEGSAPELAEAFAASSLGVLHGRYAATLLDSALGCAVHTTLPAGVAYATAARR